jgi:hypothetical protein
VRKTVTFTFQLTREGIDAHLGEMERKMDRLRSLYESYFMGMERMPPNTPRRELNRMMLEMQQVPIGNSSLRFRFQALSQKWVLHTTYWNRTLREIESGTYRRDVARTQRHLAERGGMITEEEALALGIPKNRVKAFMARHQHGQSAKSPATGTQSTSAPTAKSPATTPSAPAAQAASPQAPEPAPASARPGPPPIPASARRLTNPDGAPVVAQSLPGLADREFEDAYQRYMDAHKKMGAEVQAVTKEKMRQRLGKQLPKILADQNCDRVRLEVAVEDGKVRLRAWPAEPAK